MKTSFVTDLGAEQTITTYFLVHEKEIRNTRAGKSYLRLALGDRSGTIEAVMWDQFEASAKDISRDDIVKVKRACRNLQKQAAAHLAATPHRQVRGS